MSIEIKLDPDTQVYVNWQYKDGTVRKSVKSNGVLVKEKFNQKGKFQGRMEITAGEESIAKFFLTQEPTRII